MLQKRTIFQPEVKNVILATSQTPSGKGKPPPHIPPYFLGASIFAPSALDRRLLSTIFQIRHYKGACVVCSGDTD